jgi:hypothetical protein
MLGIFLLFFGISINEYVKTSVEFDTSDTFLKSLYEAAEACEKNNVRDYLGRPVLVEGANYNGLWLETQPMGGEMYAKRNVEIGMNNNLYFIELQQENGRYPGLLHLSNGKVEGMYTHIQGFCFPYHALNLYYWNKKRDVDYLNKLYSSLEKFDNYLWSYRDSDGDGCLEIWCIWDTGEDHSQRFSGTKYDGFPGEKPPTDDTVFPVESMDAMSYSFDARKTLGRISVLLNNGKADEWNAKAQNITDKLISYLWDDKRGACFDRNKNNEVMTTLIHNNLRCMYFNSFTQEMADRFVREHLLNPEEFFTAFPLPSIAVNDPAFRNISTNDWSGQPEGLTYQRSIRALENYGYYSQMTVIGLKLIENVGKHNTFPQQFDPFTGAFSSAGSVKQYGPTALAVLEYISRLYGIHMQFDELYWGALGRGEHNVTYVQHWDANSYVLQSKGGISVGSVDGKELFSVSYGVRVVTDWEGKVKRIINIAEERLSVKYTINGVTKTVELDPNGIAVVE